MLLFKVLALKQNGMPFSSLAPHPAPAQTKPQPRKQEQHVNKALTTTVAAEPVASNAAAIENGSLEEEGSLTLVIKRLFYISYN